MPSGEGNEYQARGLEYGAAVTGGNVDFAEDSNLESPGGRDKALLDKLKDALKPADAKRRAEAAAAAATTTTTTTTTDTTHDGRHGGVEQVMQPGRRDYNEGVTGSNSNSNSNNGGGGLMDTLKSKTGFGSNSGAGAGAGAGEPYRDSTRIDKADDQRVPGDTYRSVREDLFK